MNIISVRYNRRVKKEFCELKNFAAVCAIYGVVSLLVFMASGHLIHISMVWNLLLAVAPLAAAVFAVKAKNKWIRILFGAVWLVFLPNAFYVLTDFIHISQLVFFEGNYYAFKTVTYAHDIVIYLELVSIALGYLLAVISGIWAVRKVHVAIKKKWAPVVLTAVFLLVGYAMYIGRFIRLNSWDIVNVPLLIQKLTDGFSWFGIGMSVLFAVYSAAVYGIYLMMSGHTRKY